MNVLTKLFKNTKRLFDGGGLITFHTTHEALKAEKLIRGEGIPARLVAPPVNKRSGCDLALEFNLIEKMNIERFLRNHSIDFLSVTEIENDCPQPLRIVDRIKFPENHIMIRAGNMKLTFNTITGCIVNISGGGCPDVPYLYQMLVDHDIRTASSPKDHGYTLCALMLDRAFEEAKIIMENT